MSVPAAPTRPVSVALIGNPNTGKSTLFTALSGVRQRIGNYPGVTVEKKAGRMLYDGVEFELIDLPGTYSLSPRSPDEMVAVDVLLGRQAGAPLPDAVICIVDASNLERNLYLVSQVLEMGRPVVLALNMVDVAHTRGLKVDVARLERQLGVLVVELQAHRGQGIDALRRKLCEAVHAEVGPRENPFPAPFQEQTELLRQHLSQRPAADGRRAIPPYLVERLLLDTSGYLESALVHADDQTLRERLKTARSRLAEQGLPTPAVEAMARYAWVGRVLTGVIARPVQRPQTATDRIDRVLTHKVWGTLIFAALMLIVFQAVFTWAAPAMDLIDSGLGAAGQWLDARLPDGALKSLLIDGVLAGFGGVVVFLPQIFILFFFIGILEDCGYMARAAYLTDRMMVRVGLSGKSFIPLLSSFACAIPGIMATRVIEDRRDRLTTILIAPLMSCSARLPVYTLLIGAFIPARSYLGGLVQLQGMVMFSMYLLGVLAAVAAALALKRTLLRGVTPPFVMELPSYKWPGVRLVLYRMLERGWAFVRRAGTLIVAVSIVVWAALYFPHDPAAVGPLTVERQRLNSELAALPDQQRAASPLGEELADVERRISGTYQRQSYLGRLGRAIEPAVRPLGWDWRIGCAALASFPAREVVVSTLGVIYNLGAEVDVAEDEDRTRLQTALQTVVWEGTDRPVFNVPVALSLMAFFSLCAQCASTLAVMRRETGSWRWPILAFGYMTALAYLAALLVYQVGSRLV